MGVRIYLVELGHGGRAHLPPIGHQVTGISELPPPPHEDPMKYKKAPVPVAPPSFFKVGGRGRWGLAIEGLVVGKVPS